MDAVSEVKARLNIEDVISEYVQLKRTGRNFKGLSPWTNEKTPSFIVSPEKQIWHDFSSGKGGDMFSFVMEMEGLDFKAALELLARQAGVDLEIYNAAKPSASTKLKARALAALELAAKFYQKQLTINPAVLKYLITERKLTKKTILEWRLGYSPSRGTALGDFLTKQGFTADEMKRAGLITQGRMGTRDMFRGRIMIPLCDANGAVVGFTARLLKDEPNAPKYINTPSTIAYDKSRQIFGLHLAKQAIRKSGVAVVVEGNMDVIASHQANVKNVVASAGTAMTEYHLKTLKRFTGDVRLSFDADKAGIAATERIIPMAQKAEVDLKIITITGAKDPDELVQKDSTAWQAAINAAQAAPQWLIDHYLSQLDMKSADGKRIFSDALLPTIRRLRDPVEQEHYLKEIAKLTDTSLEAIRQKFSAAPSVQPLFRRPKIEKEAIDVVAVEHQRLQDHFLAMLLLQPKLRWLVKDLKADYFTDAPKQTILEFIRDNPDFKGDPKTANKLHEVSDYVKILSLQFEEIYAQLDFSDLEEQAVSLTRRIIDRYVTAEKEKLAVQMRGTDDEKKLKTLVKKADALNALIKK